MTELSYHRPTKATYAAVRYFFRWYQAEHGKPYPYKNPNTLAKDIDIPKEAVYALFSPQHRPDWLTLTDSEAFDNTYNGS